MASSEELALQQIKPGDYDLLIFGTRDLKEMRRFLQASPVGGAETLSSLPAVAVLHRGVSFSGYLRNSYLLGRQKKTEHPKLNTDWCNTTSLEI